MVELPFLPARKGSACRTAGFIDFTLALMSGVEILWMRLFDQRSDIGVGCMPTMWIAG